LACLKLHTEPTTDLRIVRETKVLTLPKSKKDACSYDPFGMTMPHRQFAGNQDYRFGFNGKETDSETDLQDYGFRIYNPALGKFLSVDPLTASYPWYTPYQFAGNMPIWAIDLDGLEQYIKTYRYDNGKVTLLNVVDNSYVVTQTLPADGLQTKKLIYDKRTGKPMSQSEVGMEQYKYIDNSGLELNIRRSIDGERYVKGISPMLSVEDDNWFGSTYIGPNNPEYNTGKKDENGKPIMVDDYRREPQDLMDAAALRHDKDYDLAKAHGIFGATRQRNAIAADIALVQRSNKVMEMYYNKEIDPFTGKIVSRKTFIRAKKVSWGFSKLANDKAKKADKKIIIEKVKQTRDVDGTETKPGVN
jgi:RHS repeat-associated protein